MSLIRAGVDIESLSKLLSLALGLEEVLEKNAGKNAIEKILLRTTEEGNLIFQVKGGILWRFFAITLPGRSKEYDLGQNYASIQALFQDLSGTSISEIRRAAQGITMHGDKLITTPDAIATLRKLQETLNSMLEHIKKKRVKSARQEAVKTSIADAIDKMMIEWPALKGEEKPQDIKKRAIKKKQVPEQPEGSDEFFIELQKKVQTQLDSKKSRPFEYAYLLGRNDAAQDIRKAGPQSEFSKNDYMNAWLGACPEMIRLQQRAIELQQKVQCEVTSQIERLKSFQELVQKTTGVLSKRQISLKVRQLLQAGKDLFEVFDVKDEDQMHKKEIFLQFRQGGKNYLQDQESYQVALQALQALLDKTRHELSEFSSEVQKLDEKIKST